MTSKTHHIPEDKMKNDWHEDTNVYDKLLDDDEIIEGNNDE